MNPVEALLRRAAADLDSLGIAWCIVGGLAISIQAEPRLTRLVDLAVSAPDDPSAERVILALRHRGYIAHTFVEQDAVDRLATVRMSPPDPGLDMVLLDLLFASSGIEPEIVDQAES
jgi:hypothetical protein